MLYFSNRQLYRYAQVHFVPTAKVRESKWSLLFFCDMMVWCIIHLIHKSHILLGLAFSVAFHNSIGYRIIIYCCDCTIDFNTLYHSHKYNIVYKAWMQKIENKMFNNKWIILSLCTYIHRPCYLFQSGTVRWQYLICL